MKELIIMVTVGVISLSLLTMLVPVKERTLKFLISIVFLCIIIMPFFKVLPTIKTNKITVSTPQIENEVLSIKTNSVKLLIEDILKRNNVEFQEIKVFANISQDYSITIKRVEIISNHKEEEILALLKELDFTKVVKNYEG